MLRYEVRFDAPATHHADVVLTIDEPGTSVDLWMPAWTPGSYLIREFARGVRALRAEDRDGAPLPIERVDKATFRVGRAAPGGPIVVRYRVYAFELSVRTSFVDDRGALLNPASVFLAVAGREAEEILVTVRLPKGWKVATGLPRARADAGADPSFVAADHETLVDSPIQCGTFDAFAFDVAGRRHEFVSCGGGRFDPERLLHDAERIVAFDERLFGGLPYDRYVFILHAGAQARGGLEHRNSTVLQFPRFGFADPKGWHDFLTLVAHEHFHVWNVKHARPRDFAPYDLRRETYTRLLWVCEGVTAYYDERIPLLCGAVTRGAWMQRLADEISRYREDPGRLTQSLEEASMTAWTGLYRADEDFANANVSYYRKGALVSLLLDLRIREVSGGAKSLDDVMRALVSRFGPASPGYTSGEFEALAAEAAGEDLGPFFEAYVRGTAELDFARALAPFGIDVTRRDPENGPRVRDLLGVRVPATTPRPIIETVERGSPAEAAGLSARDEIVAIDGFRVGSGDALQKRLAALPAGARARVSVFRDDELREFDVALPHGQPGRCCEVALAEKRDAPSRAVRLREAWLSGAPGHVADAG